MLESGSEHISMIVSRFGITKLMLELESGVRLRPRLCDKDSETDSEPFSNSLWHPFWLRDNLRAHAQARPRISFGSRAAPDFELESGIRLRLRLRGYDSEPDSQARF